MLQTSATGRDWVIHWELCKKLKFDHTTKGYMRKSESIVLKKMHKILWDFEIQTDHLIPAGRPKIMMIHKKEKKKELLPYSGHCRLSEPQSVNKIKAKREKST